MSKILMLCRLYEPHVGGVERHVAGLVREFKKRKHQITIITEQYDPLVPLIQNIGGARVIRIPHSNMQSKKGVWNWVSKHRDIFEKADIIHIHDVFWWYLPLRFQIKKRIYITFHGYEGSKPPRWQAIVQRKIAEKLCRGSICIGAFMQKWYYAMPNKILYGAAEINPITKVKNRAAVFLGRLDEDTGIMTYLKAIQLIKPGVTLDIYGDGPQTEKVNQYIKNHHLAAANHGEIKGVEEVLSKSRYAFVSRYLAILEAMQGQRLVVAVYNNQIKKDYLTCHPQAQNMLIAGSAEELAGRLSSLDAENEKQMIDKAYQWAKLQTWEKLADEYESLWMKK